MLPDGALGKLTAGRDVSVSRGTIGARLASPSLLPPPTLNANPCIAAKCFTWNNPRPAPGPKKDTCQTGFPSSPIALKDHKSRSFSTERLSCTHSPAIPADFPQPAAAQSVASPTSPGPRSGFHSFAEFSTMQASPQTFPLSFTLDSHGQSTRRGQSKRGSG